MKEPEYKATPASVNPGSIVNKTGDLLNAPANGANETIYMTTCKVYAYKEHSDLCRHFQPDSNQDNACKEQDHTKCLYFAMNIHSWLVLSILLLPQARGASNQVIPCNIITNSQTLCTESNMC